eukprot:UN14617
MHRRKISYLSTKLITST